MTRIAQRTFETELQIKVDKLIAQDKKASETRVKQEERRQSYEYNKRVTFARQMFGAISAINEAFLDDNKAINAGLIVADTAAAAAAAVKNGGGNPLAAIPAILFGAAQLAANNSASKGGGTISGGSGAAGAPTQFEEPEPVTTSTLEDISSSDNNSMRVELSIEGLNTLVEGIAIRTEELKRDNRL